MKSVSGFLLYISAQQKLIDINFINQLSRFSGTKLLLLKASQIQGFAAFHCFILLNSPGFGAVWSQKTSNWKMSPLVAAILDRICPDIFYSLKFNICNQDNKLNHTGQF